MMMNRMLAFLAALVVGCATFAQRPGSVISSQGARAVQSAEALARTVEARVNAAAGAKPGVAVVARARAFYDVLRSERTEFAPTLSANPPVDAARLSGDTSLLAKPGGAPVARAGGDAEVTVLDESGGWRKVMTAKGAIGWVPSQAIRYPNLAPDAGPLTTSTHARIAATILYPEGASTAAAIRRMASGQVSAVPNRCAGSMREALGWGLGDAHVWATGLPQRGYIQRGPGELAQPGDIIVWPFTFGSRSRQHIGFAVEQGGKVVLLSNLSGSIVLSQILPGYLAFAPR